MSKRRNVTAGIPAMVRRLPDGSVQIKVPLRRNPVRIEDMAGHRFANVIPRLERYGNKLLMAGNAPDFVAPAIKEALGNWVRNAVIIAEHGGRRAVNPKRRRNKAYWQSPYVVLVKGGFTGSTIESLSGGFNTLGQTKTWVNGLRKRSLHRGRHIEIVHNTPSAAKVVWSKEY